MFRYKVCSGVSRWVRYTLGQVHQGVFKCTVWSGVRVIRCLKVVKFLKVVRCPDVCLGASTCVKVGIWIPEMRCFSDSMILVTGLR